MERIARATQSYVILVDESAEAMVRQTLTRKEFRAIADRGATRDRIVAAMAEPRP